MLNQDSYNDILTPREVALLMPSSVPISWIYAHWEDLGGIRIGRRKLILRSVLYANLQGKRLLVRENREGRKEMDTPTSRYEPDEMEEEKRGQTATVCRPWGHGLPARDSVTSTATRSPTWEVE